MRGQLVFQLLVRGDTEPGFLHRRLGETAGIVMGGARHGVDDRHGRVAVVALKHLGGPVAALKHEARLAGQRRLAVGDIDEGPDLRLHHALLRRAPMISARASPMAISTRRSRSSHAAWVIKTPGLNWRTLGSSVEKMAQTPFS